MSTFWSLWVIVLTSVNLVLLFWILMANRKVAIKDDAEPDNQTTGHVYDGIEEYDNPLPKWWFYMFIATFAFTVIYLIAYPGMGNWKGMLGWTSVNQLEREEKQAEIAYGDSFSQFMDMPIEQVAQDPRAIKMGVRLFADNCAICHGADAGGNYGFPNLTDDDWLYGGTPEKIVETITKGRFGTMPPWGPVIGEANVQASAEYVLQLSGQKHDAELASKGEPVFAQNCAACHGPDGKGIQAMGAPNLTDDIWLYDGSPQGIRHSIRNGRSNEMPAQEDKLRADKIHLIAAYVYSLSQYEE
jgi:cytochrome c oxidase cbb3-type subunit 3